MLRGKFRKLTGHFYSLSIPKKGRPLSFKKGITKPASYKDGTFTFLNRSYSFTESIDWNFDRYGKLWAYNLNYYDYLLQKEMAIEEGFKLIQEFIDQIESNREGLEPYSISLRGMNWIKFLSYNQLREPDIDASLFAQYQMLMDNREYHLLGNHLLENGCSLLFGAYYFQDEELLEAAKKILNEQLDEQVLSDGGHFERSTMYHHIMLDRLLDCYNLVANNEIFQLSSLKKNLLQKISLMLGWAEEIAMGEGEMPMLNDAAAGIAPSLGELLNYSKRLRVSSQKIRLSESGYRKYREGPFELLCDVGNIGPDYIPGHAHSDTFSFVLYCKGKPVIIDPGISTYENNDRRQRERSTAFHNTVQLEDKEQSEVWSAFRVGRRAKVHEVQEHQDEQEQITLSAWHDGYEPWGVQHKRNWRFERGGKRIIIRDQLIGNTSMQGVFRLYFHDLVKDEIKIENHKVILDDITISFSNKNPIEVKNYDLPLGYNSNIKGKRIKIPFEGEITTYIDYIEKTY